MFLLLVLAGCDPTITDKDPADDTGGGDADTDTDSDTDTDTGPTGDVEGPDLPECTPQSGSGANVALSGVVLTPDGPVAGYVVYSRTSGTIGWRRH